MTSHSNRLDETIRMNCHTIGFGEEITDLLLTCFDYMHANWSTD